MAATCAIVPTFRRILIANRGEVAVRIAQTCDRLGIEPIFAVSTADREAPYLKHRRYVVLGPAKAAESYLDLRRIVQAAKQTGCTALHPGWGFLAENPLFANLCEQHGVCFIGPSAAVMQLMGRKTPAKQSMAAAGLSCIPGSNGVLADLDEAKQVAEQVGFPVLLKAESGGGGRGMRVAQKVSELATAYADAQAEAQAAFGDPRMYLEKLIEGGRHVELQVLADRYGGVVHLGERDCSVQRNHQKLIEESPALSLNREELERSSEAALEACRRIGYVGAGTFEFLLDQDGTLRFMEMNTRLQVEHCVSEMRTGVDLVAEQILIAAGHRLKLQQSSINFSGHAIECRINAEDPNNGFCPNPGIISKWRLPESSQHVRIDTHVEDGYEVPPYYDSLLCKVIAHDSSRDQACDRMIEALGQLQCEGLKTTIPMHLAILQSKDFRENNYDTRRIPGWSV